MRALEGEERVRVLREPGWTLLGDPGASEQLWHLVASRRYDGMLSALCGVTGRYVADVEHEIICCPACVQAATPVEIPPE